MRVAYATLICPLQAGTLIQALIICSQTGVTSQRLTSAEYCTSCYSVFPSSFPIPILHVIFTARSPVFTLNRDGIIDFLMCFFPKYFPSCYILRVGPQRDRGILPNLQVSASQLRLYNPDLNSLFVVRTPQGISAAGFSTAQGILGLVQMTGILALVQAHQHTSSFLCHPQIQLLVPSEELGGNPSLHRLTMDICTYKGCLYVSGLNPGAFCYSWLIER